MSTKKIYIVTGGNSGIGYHTIANLLTLNATVVMASRSQEKAQAAIATLEAQKFPGKVVFMPLDLMRLDSVRAFAKTFLSSYDRLDGLVNNAGIMFGRYQLTVDGLESQMATNHYGHFALTGLLLPMLIQSQGRIVNVSSIAHRRGEMEMENLQFTKTKSYSPWEAYSRSKLANLLFTFELDRRLKAKQIPVTVVAAHPGVSKTKLLFKENQTQPLYHLLKKLLPIQSAQRGAIPLIEAVMRPGLQGGEYFGPNGLFEMGGTQARLVKATALSRDPKLGKAFFDHSETVTNTTFPLNLLPSS